MDPASLAAGLVAAQMAQAQMAMAAKMVKMNAGQGQAIAQLLDAAAQNGSRLANVATGVGQNVDIKV